MYKFRENIVLLELVVNKLMIFILLVVSFSAGAKTYYRVSESFEEVLLTPVNLDLVPLFKSKPKKNCVACQSFPVIEEILNSSSVEIVGNRKELEVILPSGESFIFEKMDNEFGFMSVDFDKAMNGKYLLKLLNYYNLKVFSIHKKRFFSSEYRFIGLFGFHVIPDYRGN
jgi:hypothetical protein